MTKSIVKFVNVDEWRMFAKYIGARPWLALVNAVQLLGLVGRRLIYRVWLRFQVDPHQGLKLRPRWLQSVSPPDSGNFLFFPDLSLLGAMPRVERCQFSDCDPEYLFQLHRWSACVESLGHQEYASNALEAVLDWIKNPPRRDHPAWETYSCCERVANLAILLASNPSLRSGIDAEPIRQFFCETGAWIDSHLEYYGPDRTNNHFLNNGRALLIAGVVTGHQPWIDVGLTIVRRFAPILFPKDGCLREGSSHYQLVVSGWLFDVLLFARDPGGRDEQLSELELLAQQAGRICARFASSIPEMDTHIGDISPDLHPQITLARLKLLYPEQLIQSAPCGQKGEWIFVEQGLHTLCAHAPLEWPPACTTHAHSDLGGGIWLHRGSPILVDPGRASYLAGVEGGNQFGPEAHNVLMVNGHGALSESVLNIGIWYPRPYADATVKVVAKSDGFAIRHNGFNRLPGVGMHHREINIVGQGLEVIDELNGPGEVKLVLLWHFMPGYLEQDASRVVRATDCVVIKSIGLGSQGAKWGNYLYSRCYGSAEQARYLKLTGVVELPCRVITSFSFSSCVE